MVENKIRLDYIADQIRASGCTPVISNQLVLDMLFGKYGVAQALAKELGYPFADNHMLSRVAQYLRIKEERPDLAKWKYLDFLKQQLLKIAQARPGADQPFLAGIAAQIKRLHVTDLAVEHLKCLDCAADPPDNPLSVLARLDIPVYLTTCHHLFLEATLKQLQKKPRTEVYRWHDCLKIPNQFAVDLTYVPSVEAPLVYHLQGIEDIPTSLVLTEDDHLDFLVSIRRDFNNAAIIPASVRTAVTTSVLLLLGYDIHGWDLRTVLKGFVEESQQNPLHPISVAIQINPEDRQADTIEVQQWHEYLESFFKTVQIEVFWDTTDHFMTALWNELQ